MYPSPFCLANGDNYAVCAVEASPGARVPSVLFWRNSFHDVKCSGEKSAFEILHSNEPWHGKRLQRSGFIMGKCERAITGSL